MAKNQEGMTWKKKPALKQRALVAYIREEQWIPGSERVTEGTILYPKRENLEETGYQGPIVKVRLTMERLLPARTMKKAPPKDTGSNG